jgi:peptide chain release factor subunit 1
MQVAPPDREGLRRLAELRLDRPVVLSLYLNLDPTEFATPPARATAVRSLLDEAERRMREVDGLSHRDRGDLERALERARSFLQRDLNAEGAHGLAVFVCEPIDLFEAIKLPRSVPACVAIDRAPLVGPLARLERRERWCVALVSRRDARVFRGSAEGLREVAAVRDEVHGQHDQGGWSQARYQRSIEKEKDDHLRHAADLLMRHFKRQPFERLVLGGPNEVVSDFESKLHRYLSQRLAGRIDVDVETSGADAVLAAARPVLEALEDAREREALERLDEGSRSASGLADVLRALNERRVETLLLVDRLSEAGARCPECGWLGPPGERQCPADGAGLEQRDDVIEPAVEVALQQAAEVLPVRRREAELAARGGIAALLRF